MDWPTGYWRGVQFAPVEALTLLPLNSKLPSPQFIKKLGIGRSPAENL
jgi:hypothetical protein